MSFARIETHQAPRVPERIQATVGDIALTWNAMHVAIFYIFAALTGLDKNLASAVFYTLKADSAQRDITKAAAMVRLSENAPAEADLRQKIKDLLRDIGKFAGPRNGAVHAAIVWDGSGTARVNPFNPAPTDSPRRGLFHRLNLEAANLDRLAERAADIFNETAELLELPPEFLG
jgi:hypothetical protein